MSQIVTFFFFVRSGPTAVSTLCFGLDERCYLKFFLVGKSTLNMRGHAVAHYPGRKRKCLSSSVMVVGHRQKRVFVTGQAPMIWSGRIPQV